MRHLHEAYRVPLIAISRATEVSIDWLRERKRLANWVPTMSVHLVRRRLEKAFWQHAANLVGRAPKADGEKTARALSLLAKGLESLDSVDRDQGSDSETENKVAAHGRQASLDQRNAMDLDLELAGLVERLSEPGSPQ